ncbi:MAG: OadG family protein [Paludibacteraceae bacterium]|nr:OadG family protein [Paludibacteraceae bacterium]
MLLAVTADTWIVTGLGFGIVLVLLFCLVFILLFFGWVMQKISAPHPPIVKQTAKKTVKEDENVMAAIAMALYLSRESKHDAAGSMITFNKRDTAWNPKSEGFNNVGF